MKSSGSRTLSAFFMLVLFASIFFISCGLPKNPFIIDTILVSPSADIPIKAETSLDSIYFSIKNIDNIYTNNGINLFYCYTTSNTIILKKLSNINLINTISYNNPQHIEIDDDLYDIYIFKIGEDNTYTFPSININDVLSSLSGATSLEGRLLATASSDNSIYLDLSLYLTTKTTDLLSDGRLVRFAEFSGGKFSGGKEDIKLSSEDYDYSETVIISEDEYYLHLFAAYYVYEPSYEIDYDSIIADTEVTYLGSVELP